MRKSFRRMAARLLSLLLTVMMLFTVCSISVLAESADTAAGTEADLPSPSATFYIYDEEEVLGVATKNAILTRNGNLYEKYGIQIVIMTLKEIPGADIGAKGGYLHRIIDSWQIGGTDEKCLVLALSVTQQDYVAVAGDGLSAEFPVETWSTLFTQSLEPKFSAGEYDAGVLEFFTALADKAERYAEANNMSIVEATAAPSATPEAAAEETEEEPGALGKFLKAIGLILFIVLVILIIGFIVIYVHGQMVLKKRREARRRRAMQARAQQNERPQPSKDDEIWNRY